jgi:hypothetical protein
MSLQASFPGQCAVTAAVSALSGASIEKRGTIATGEYNEMSEMTNLKTFVTSLAGHVADEAARTMA